jgi:hypothetical protein
MFALANAREKRGLPDIFEVDRRKGRARLRTETASPHVADVPQRSQPLGGVESDLRQLVVEFAAVRLGFVPDAGLFGKQFRFARARAQQLPQQHVNPLGIGCRQLGDSLGKSDQFVGVEWSVQVAHQRSPIPTREFLAV